MKTMQKYFEKNRGLIFIYLLGLAIVALQLRSIL